MKTQRNSIIIIVLALSIITFAYFSMQKPVSVSKKDVEVNIVRSKPLVPDVKPTPVVLATNPIPKPVTQTPTPATNPAPSIQTTQYSTSVSYDVPGSSQSLSLKLTLQNNIVIDVSTSLSMSGGESAGYQKRFASSYKSQVMNKNIKNINLSRVGGASLTTEAFNMALDKIKNSL